MFVHCRSFWKLSLAASRTTCKNRRALCQHKHTTTRKTKPSSPWHILVLALLVHRLAIGGELRLRRAIIPVTVHDSSRPDVERVERVEREREEDLAVILPVKCRTSAARICRWPRSDRT